MDVQTHIAKAMHLLIPSSGHEEAVMLDNSLTPAGALDGSAEAIARFLRDMAELTGEPGDKDGVPILTLQFGSIVTVTSITSDSDLPFLTITTLLPPVGQACCFSSPTGEQPYLRAGRHADQVLWDAGEGRHVFARRIPASMLPDERSVLDAILDACDDAKAWHASAIGS